MIKNTTATTNQSILNRIDAKHAMEWVEVFMKFDVHYWHFRWFVSPYRNNETKFQGISRHDPQSFGSNTQIQSTNLSVMCTHAYNGFCCFERRWIFVLCVTNWIKYDESADGAFVNNFDTIAMISTTSSNINKSNRNEWNHRKSQRIKS